VEADLRRRVAFGALGAVLLLCSIGLGLLGRAVLDTPSSLTGASADLPSRVDARTPRAGLSAHLAGSFLGVRSDEEAFAAIVSIYREAVSFLATAGDPKGPIRIARLLPRVESPGEEAQALTMAATLLAYSAGAGFGAALPPSLQAPTVVVLDQTIQDLRAAILFDPSGETAKFDLELILRQLKPPPHRTRASRRAKGRPKGKGAGRAPKGSNGQEHHAGIYSVGSGY
jgi:hypothetical protein